jgi:chemotaxis-related protein WspB
MLFILFEVDRDRYALPASRIIEVLPLVNLKKIPQSPAGVAGVFNYRGTPVPVIDLSEMMLGIPAAHRLSTRIVMVEYPLDIGRRHKLGLIAENATRTFARAVHDFSEVGLTPDNAPYLGPVATDDGVLIQWVAVEKLLKPEVRDLLFRERVET